MQAQLPSRYRLLEEVGQGGMAVVFRATDEVLKREVAIKILHSHLLAEGESKARLQREAQAVAKLAHDNIVQIYDYSGPDSASSFIVTEFIEGRTLKQVLTDRRLPFPQLAALVVLEIASAVEHAHQLGILHRDIKPENVMVRKDGMLKLMDFGVAQVIDLERMTVTGQLIGSPAYMAPELIDGRDVDFRTDVFALGIMLYQLATGELPFTGRNPHEVFKRITEGVYPDPRTKNLLVGNDLARIIARALARQPADRYPTVTALIEDLRAHVACSGLNDARSELRAYFQNPEQAESTLPARMAKALLDAGRSARKNKRFAGALDLLNRALLLQPGDEALEGEVRAEIRRLEGGRRMKRMAVGGVVVGLLVAAGLFVQHQQPTISPGRPATPEAAPTAVAQAPEPPGSSAPLPPQGVAVEATAPPVLPAVPGGPEPAAADNEPEGAVEMPGARDSATRRVRLPRTDRRVAAAGQAAGPAQDPTQGPAAVGPVVGQVAGTPGTETTPVAGTSPAAATPAGSAKPVRFTLGTSPPVTTVFLDGKAVTKTGTRDDVVEIPWAGEHLLEFRNDACCYPSDAIRLGPDLPRPPGDHIGVRLKGLPARLAVQTVPPTQGTKFLVKQLSGTWEGSGQVGGPSVQIPFSQSTQFDMSLEVTVFVGDKDSPPETRTLRIRAGETASLTIKLP